ncbi:hypothetical protein VTK73DRAFT_193 [Phialemonium thermophilum]|uniref:Uncharacterized protein n=1 Tax=Phialemonium thermophilum TaxID=223376 RepID=A0ABR3XGN3_9PEZI
MAASSLDMGTNSVGYSCFESSWEIVKSRRWHVEVNWRPLSEDAAKDFIKTSPRKDNRKLMGRSRFRFLHAQCLDQQHLYKQEELLQIAKEHGWVNDVSKFLMNSQTGGVVLSESEESIQFAVQASTEYGSPFYGMFLSELRSDDRRRDVDWVCLLVSDNNFDRSTFDSLLYNDPYPSDLLPPLSPDLMFLPVSFLRWQTDQIKSGLNGLRIDIAAQGEKVSTANASGLAGLRESLYKMRRTYLSLHARWSLAKDLASNVARCFDILEQRANSRDEDPITYSRVLRNKLRSESANLDLLLHDLDAMPMRMDAQQTMLDNQASMILVRNSEKAAEQARRDSTSMRTIAVMTLLFLPGTFVATIFSMSVFNWQAKGDPGDRIASRWIWLYFVISAVLTGLVMVVWIVWFRRADKKFQKKWEQRMV